MANALEFRSVECKNPLTRFVFNHNPFYLISCFLVLYGLQLAAPTGGDFFAPAMRFVGGMAGYTMLMAATAISVVRCCRVWEDARSILMVVIISLVALSTGLDQWCVTHWTFATAMLVVSGIFSIVVCETILVACRLRFPFWYRTSFYTMLMSLFASPVFLGYAVRNQYDMIANSGALLFSVAIAAAMLLLMPAIRAGSDLVARNGTPWSYPWYPLSAFAVMISIAMIRAHAIWFSFGFEGGPVRFEPFLLLPVAWSGLILLVAADRGKISWPTQVAMLAAPFMLLTGFTNGGVTHLPISEVLHDWFGCSRTVIMIAIVGFYFFAWLSRAPGAGLATAVTVLLIPWVGELSPAAETLGVQRWMFAALATVLVAVVALRQPRLELHWLASSTLAAATMFMSGWDRDFWLIASTTGFAVAIGSWLLIGYWFDSAFAGWLRRLSAVVLLVISAALSVLMVRELPETMTAASLGMLIRWSGWISTLLIGLSIGYLLLVRRTGWLAVVMFQAGVLIVATGWSGFQRHGINDTTLSLETGMASFAVGLMITSIKSGAPRRYWRRQGWRRRFRRGI